MASERAAAYVASDDCTRSLLSICRRHRVPGMEPEDLVQAAKLVLLTVNADVNEAWLYKRAKGVILSVARKEYKRAAREIPVESHEVSAIASADDTTGRIGRIQAACRALLRSLPAGDRRIVREIVAGKSYAVIAARHRMSDSQVSRIYVRSVAAMAKAAQKGGLEPTSLFKEGAL